MANFDTIKTAIDANIKTNGTQDITGGKMNSILKQMVDATDAELTELESELDRQQNIARIPLIVKREITTPIINSVIYNVSGKIDSSVGTSATRRRYEPIYIQPNVNYYYTGVWSNTIVTGVIYLDENGNKVGQEIEGTGTNVSYEDYLLTIPNNAVIMCVQSQTDLLRIDIEGDERIFVDKNDYFQSAAKKQEIVDIPLHENNGYINYRGEVVESSSAIAIVSQEITIERSNKYLLSTRIDQYRVGVAFYDKNHNYIGSQFRATEDTSISDYIDFPYNAHYFRVCSTSSLTLLKITETEAVAKEQGSENEGKILRVSANGKLELSVPDFVEKEQGIINAGKALIVQEDGRVGLGEVESGGESTDISRYIKQIPSFEIYLGDNLVENVIGGGDGWSYEGGIYTHTQGATTALEFPLATEQGEKYIISLKIGNANIAEGYINVSIGDEGLCDVYNGTIGPLYVGVISNGGNLKITADANYSSTVYNVELRKIVTEELASKSIILTLENVDSQSMADNLTGFWNIAIGPNNSTLGKLQNGSRNIGIGLNSLTNIISGERNIGLGTFTLNQLLYGVRNIAIGADALYRVAYARDNVAIGKAAMGKTYSDIFNTTFTENVSLGTNALGGNYKTCERNVAVGHGAVFGGTGLNTDKRDCVAVGYESGYYETERGVSIGSRAGRYTRGTDNVHIGANAGDSTTTGSQCTIIGSQAKAKDGNGTWQNPTTLDNVIAIGYNATAKKSNQVVIGNQNNNEFILGNRRIIFNEDGTCSWEYVA